MSVGPHTVPPSGARLIWHPSPNFGPRKGGLRPTLIVVHYTAMDSAEAALDRLCDPEFEVSAHYLIAQDGRVVQMVAEDMRAWHAGAGAWGGVTDVNSASIGIELCNRGDHAFPDPQIDALVPLLAAVRSRWGIPKERVIGHSDMAPARKQDPGRFFPWPRLAQAGQAVFRGQGGGDVIDFQAAAVRFGYPDTASHDAVLDAFRQRFRPDAVGPLDPEDARILSDLAQTWPVDAATAGA